VPYANGIYLAGIRRERRERWIRRIARAGLVALGLIAPWTAKAMAQPYSQCWPASIVADLLAEKYQERQIGHPAYTDSGWPPAVRQSRDERQLDDRRATARQHGLHRQCRQMATRLGCPRRAGKVGRVSGVWLGAVIAAPVVLPVAWAAWACVVALRSDAMGRTVQLLGLDPQRQLADQNLACAGPAASRRDRMP
jgi:hypothetical protein